VFVKAKVLRDAWHAALGAGMSLFALSLPAAAQQMLDHGFVEPCTMSNVAEQRLECEVCPSAVGARQCREKLEPRGFSQKCRTRGGHSGWEEIWCKARVIERKNPESGTWRLVLGALGTLGAMGLMMRVISGKGEPGVS
jgi:hypothetical protein